ncbi:probable metal-nicotianamine transporter YSL7 [Pistacia vera]|uniref:probable metal-nicotianamine transporter YSL7 n=1 Tax=Pistacia vera TaxID=55513 RepID=UPI00126303B2|nr:probable metal-nicotianamine transporter YSL7 [Pistacia vera]
MGTSLILSVVFNFIVCKLNLTTGVIPSFNVSAGLLGYALVKSWTTLLEKFGMLKHPFTRQENTVIQTCIVASSGIAFSSGTASYLMAMSPRVAAEADGGNTPENVKALHLGWMTAFLFAVSFVGLFCIVPLRKMMILKYKLTYPSGTATAYLINSFHTPKGAKLAKKQVAVLFKSFGFSFVFAFFQWFFTGGDSCGFSSFPTFGLQAFKQKFFFDFSSTYVGVGMICPYIVNVSLLLGAVISWGIMWPIIETKKGIWYSAELSASSLHGIQGYRVFIAIAMMLGDGLYHVVSMLITTLLSLLKQHNSRNNSVSTSSIHEQITEIVEEDYDTKRRTEFFLKDQIPNWAACTGYVILVALAMICVPLIFNPLKWYHILVAFVVAPVLAFCNAYGCGLTDWSLASNYGKIAIIIFSSWVGLHNGGIVAGLAACGVMMSTVATASDLMQDFKTGYLTLSSPRAMFVSQVIGTTMGCIITPLVFWFFYQAYPIGDPKGTYPAPYAQLYRGIAILGVEGVSTLPKNCLKLSIAFFIAAIAVNIVCHVLRRYETKYKIYRFIPSPMCMAIPFYLGGYFAIDMCIGSLILFLWTLKNKRMADDYVPAVASGLICGESLWGVPAAVLSLVNLNAPICMKFLSAKSNARVDIFLNGS